MSTAPGTREASGVGAHESKLRVLMVEDSELDAVLLEHALARGGFHTVCRRVDTPEAMAAALERQEWDVILADHAMPQFSAPEALEMTQRHGLDVPFIIVSGHIEEDTAVSAMKAGAHDYVMKNQLARLVPAVRRELREAEMRRVQRECEMQLRQAHEQLELRVQQRTADLQAANAELQRVLEQRHRLEQELLEIAENERRRIGFDLHDDLGQKLTGVSMMLKGLEKRLLRESHPLAEDATRVRELIQQVIEHTHNLAHQFSSMGVAGKDLVGVLDGLAANAEKMFGIDCQLEVRGGIPELAPNAIVQLSKIAQEAISNAIKHGRAAHIHLRVHVDERSLRLEIQNDGNPFHVPEGKKNRMGLRIMNYRANTIGAVFDIKPGSSNGSVATCVLPVRQSTTPPPRASTETAKPARRRVSHTSSAQTAPASHEALSTP